ncbi:MAG: type I restriction enzyme HsdR N-terminal domain-containing protein [Chlamydiales bacterium]
MKIEITALSKYSSRRPEEKIRQALIQKMVDEWGFPKGLISVERKSGARRYDLLCYTREMTPLLLVECKAGAVDEAAISQALGYNEIIGAPFICVAGAQEILTFWHEKGRLASVPFLPVFGELYAISRRF